MVEHGDYTVTIEDSIIYVTFVGMFNDIASQKLCTYVETLIENMDGAAFYLLFNMLEYEGSTPEAHKVGDQHFKWLETQNCIARASVVSSMLLVEISRNEQAALRESSITSKVFDNEYDARKWLLSFNHEK